MDTTRDFERRQLATFAILWTAYAAYYLCRMNLAGAQATILQEYSLDKTQFGPVIAAFTLVYGLGQLLNGPLCDRFGARVMLTTGMFGSACVNIAFSFADSLPAMGVLWMFNGLFQSMGFAACVKTLAAWFPAHQRGRVSGWFSLSYKIGNIAAWALVGWLVTYDWRWAFRVPAGLIAVAGVYTLLRLRDKPAEQGRVSALGTTAHPSSSRALPLMTSVKWMLTTPELWLAAVSCFAVAITTYGYLFWLPNYLADTGSSALMAGLKAACYPLGGCVGAVTLGWVSDRILGGRRPPIIATTFFGGALFGAALPLIPENAMPLRIICVTLTGALIMGGHAHVVTSVAMDVATRHTAGTATGFIDAMGYLGATATGIGSGWIADRWGWDCVFFTWSGAAFVAGALMCLLWTHKPDSEGEA